MGWAPLPALRYSVWTLVNVKRLALLAPKDVFVRACRLLCFRVKFSDSLQFAAAVGFFGVIDGYVAHGLAWRFYFHFVDSPLVRGYGSTPFKLSA